MRFRGLLLAILWGIGDTLVSQGAPEIVVASYNLENFVGEDTVQETASGRRTPAKKEAAIAAVVRIIKEIHPDILGMCEMGSADEFTLFQKRLVENELYYTDSEYVQAADPNRHVALLSRFPIVARHSATDLTFDLNGAPRKMSRGILDVTVQVNAAYTLRLVGVHLKSKLAVVEGEALIRRHEAALVRERVDEILAGDPQTNLLLYGDFNETRNEVIIHEIAGIRGGPARLTELPTEDAVGDRWTHYWKLADVYARIDYFFASAGLLKEIVPKSSRIYRSEYWNEASDHRLIYTSIIPAERSR